MKSFLFHIHIKYAVLYILKIITYFRFFYYLFKLLKFIIKNKDYS